jgi:hypothetical protein
MIGWSTELFNAGFALVCFHVSGQHSRWHVRNVEILTGRGKRQMERWEKPHLPAQACGLDLRRIDHIGAGHKHLCNSGIGMIDVQGPGRGEGIGSGTLSGRDDDARALRATPIVRGVHKLNRSTGRARRNMERRRIGKGRRASTGLSGDAIGRDR